MTKEKLKSLNKYLNDIQSKLQASTPEKHSSSPNEYKAFLEREFRLTKAKVDSAK